MLLTLLILAGLGMATGALAGGALGGGVFLGATVGFVAAVTLWGMSFALVQQVAPSRLEDDWIIE